MNRFIVAVENASAAQQNIITGFLQKAPLSMWHHIQGFWLVVGAPEGTTAQSLCEEIRKLPTIEMLQLIVICIPQGVVSEYYGFAPKESWDWMRQCWGPVASAKPSDFGRLQP